jgi:hypothetical protein
MQRVGRRGQAKKKILFYFIHSQKQTHLFSEEISDAKGKAVD